MKCKNLLNGDFYISCYYRNTKDGVYGVTVNTEACGAFNSGSIPDRHPKINEVIFVVSKQTNSFVCAREPKSLNISQGT